MQFAPGCSRVFSGLFSYSFLHCSSCLRCGSLWRCLSAVQALLGFLFPCSLLLGFSAASSFPPFCAAPVASAAGLSAFPRLRLATSLISLALLLCLAVLRLMLRYLGLLRLLPSSSLCLVRVLLSFGRGLWLRSIPVLWLRFLRLLFITFACLRLCWCLLYGSYPHAGCRFFAGSSSYLLFFVGLFLVLLLIVVDFLSSVERVHSTLGG